MYISVVQCNPKLGALQENLDKALKEIDKLAASFYPPDLVIFPAYALSGTPVGGLRYSDAFAAELVNVMTQFLLKAKLPTLIGTMLPRPYPADEEFSCEPEALYTNGSFGKPLGFINFDANYADENFVSSIFGDIGGHKVAILLDDYPDLAEDFSDAELAILLLAKDYRGTNSMLTASQQLNYLKNFATKNKLWLVAVNLVGAQDENVFDGASVVIRPDGTVADALPPFEEGVLLCNMNLSAPDFQADEQESEDAEGFIVKPLLPCEADWKALSLFLKDYVQKNGFTDVVLGLSGGLDSAVAATLAADALGSKHVHGVLMPGSFSSQGSIDDSLALAANLEIDTRTVAIDGIFEAALTNLQVSIDDVSTATPLQNLQARIRMLQLMHLSNSFDWLLLSTSNKSELAMGYTTLYGDSAGAICPFGNIYKTDMYRLAEWRNEQSRVIPEGILTKAPSAELCAGQTDSDTLPPYEFLDLVLKLHVDEGFGVDQILAYLSETPSNEEDVSELVERLLNTVTNAEFKRRQCPLAPTLGYVDLTRERDWPITNGFRDRHSLLWDNEALEDFFRVLDERDEPRDWGYSPN